VFLWSGRQAVFLLVMLVLCAMALTHSVWHHWYEKIVPPMCIIMVIPGVGLCHAEMTGAYVIPGA
jgi:hypothetical protein